jgi:hypothetical protein
MPKRRGRPHQHHHSVRERRLRQRGLQLPDPLIPSGHFGLPVIPRIIPRGWRFRPVPPFLPGNGNAGLLFLGFVLVMFGCVVAALLLSAIAR